MTGELTTLEGGALARMRVEAEGYAAASRSANTARAYAADWADFTTWCVTLQASSLPADQRTVAAYLIARAHTLSVATLARRLATIRTAHREADLEPPAGPDLKRTWSGIRRKNGRPPVKKAALTLANLRLMVGAMDLKTAAGLRDRALILVGFASALRRSELAEMCFDCAGETATVRCRFVPEGLQITLDRSKGDQEGLGQAVGIPHGRTALDPVGALLAWMEFAGLKKGPVFRPVDRHGRVAYSALSPKAVGDIVKTCGARVGIDPARLGGHSLRSGLITAAIAAGVAPDVVMRQSRHARFDTMRGYIRDGELFNRNAAGNVGL